MDRGEQPRKNTYSLPLESEYQIASRKYENNPNTCILNFVLTHPSIDVRLIGELLYEGAMTHCEFDRGVDVYKSCITIHNAPRNDMDYELDKSRHVPILRKDRDRDARMRDFHILNLIGGGGYGVFFINQVGYGNKLTEPFVEMIRDFIEEGIRKIRIVYLTSRYLEETLELEQFQQFRNSYELGDTVVQFEELHENPMEFLLKLRPQHYPVPKTIFNILQK